MNVFLIFEYVKPFVALSTGQDTSLTCLLFVEEHRIIFPGLFCLPALSCVWNAVGYSQKSVCMDGLM